MTNRMAKAGCVVILCLLAACSRAPVQAKRESPPTVMRATDAHRKLRTTGTVEALRSFTIQVPRVSGQQSGNLTLTKLAANGTVVRPGDVIAEFDHTAQIKAARDAGAKFDDLSHQVEQKAAEHKSNAAKRASDMAQAEADLGKARLEIRKGPVLSDIEKSKADEILKGAEAHVASLKISTHAHEVAETAELQVLRLQAERQKLTLTRLEGDADKLVLRATIPGMIALQSVWKNNSMGHAQEGDQLWPGSPLLKIFDPSSMVLQLSVSETDGAVLHTGTRAVVHLDAYPELQFTAHYDSSSPIATSPLGSPLKAFVARFVLEQSDKHLLPDLAAAADVEAGPELRSAK